MKATTMANGMVMPTMSALCAAKEEDENDQNQPDACEHRVSDPVDGGIDQRRAIQIGNNLHVLRFELLIELGDLGMHALQHLGRIGAAQQQDGPLDRKSTRLNSSHLSVSRMPSSA
jgi:hypothetical protein